MDPDPGTIVTHLQVSNSLPDDLLLSLAHTYDTDMRRVQEERPCSCAIKDTGNKRNK